MSRLVQRWMHRLYTPYTLTNDLFFLEKIKSLINPASIVLDAGAGAGIRFPYQLRGQVAQMIGVDTDARVEQNQQLDKGLAADLTSIPMEDACVDLVFSRSVLEHVDHPQPLLREIHRVLKPGGHFLFMTPNRWHYVCFIARHTSHSFHLWVNRKRGRDEEDTFPTVYKLNTRRDVRREFAAAGFVERELIMRETCPSYLLFAMPAFLLGVAYERLVNSSDWLSGFRVNIIGHFIKPSPGEM